MEKIETYFLGRVRHGYVPSVADLLSYVKKHKLAVSGDKTRKLRAMRRKFKFMAMMMPSKRPPAYFSVSYPKIGVLYVDLAEFRPDLRKFNEGCAAFLVAVDSLSQKLALEKCPDKTAQSWQEALKRMLETQFDSVHLILSDNDCVASADFAKSIFEKYRVRWGYLKNRSKSYLAERRISTTKMNLTELMQANSTKNWTQYLEPICLNYNSQVIKGSRFKRSQIDKTNYLEHLNALFRTSDASLMFNSYSMGKFSPEMSKRLFKYSIGQRCYLSRQANYKVKKSVFDKKSVLGVFGDQEFTIKERSLKHDGKFMLAVVYKLKEIEGNFYENEILGKN